MFSDLVGSTALSARMDPEDLREIISAYQKCVADTMQRFGGFVAKYMGDGVLIFVRGDYGKMRHMTDEARRMSDLMADRSVLIRSKAEEVAAVPPCVISCETYL
jgi:class 3 adenylate cyclase